MVFCMFKKNCSYTLEIEAVSCDELYADCSDVMADTGASALEFATLLRQEILEKTRCTASAGLGNTRLVLTSKSFMCCR